MEQRHTAPLPHKYKQMVMKSFADRNRAISSFVETGTYQGDMVEAVKPIFKNIWSIELSEELAAKAAKRFEGNGSIQILQGDSGKVIEQVVAKLEGPALFWLDGHYSEGVTAKGDLNTPVVKELECIVSSKNPDHVILIDDARLFDGTQDYPTLDQVREVVGGIYDTVEVRGDIIRIYNKNR